MRVHINAPAAHTEIDKREIREQLAMPRRDEKNEGDVPIFRGSFRNTSGNCLLFLGYFFLGEGGVVKINPVRGLATWSKYLLRV